MQYANTVQTRETGQTMDILNGAFGKPIGWFKTIDNPFGWSLHKPDAGDIEWFNSQNESLTNVYRIISDKGHTNLVKMSKRHGTVYFFDDEFYVNTDLITWEFKGVRVIKLYFDK